MAPTAKVERLLNLVIALLATRRYLTAEKIRATVKGYGESPSDEAFSRMFERDKNELRDLGIPLETGKVSAFETVEGYRINPDAYALPAIDLTREEAAAVAIAVQLWQSPELRANAEGAVAKLHAAGIDVDAKQADVLVAPPTALPGIHRAEPALGALMDAVQAGQAVQFEHRPSPVEPYVTRTLEPWGVVTHTGRWYVVGHDRDRNAVRTFRMSRIGPDVRPIGPAGAVTRPTSPTCARSSPRPSAMRPAGCRHASGSPMAGPWRCAGPAPCWPARHSPAVTATSSASTSEPMTGWPGRSPVTGLMPLSWTRRPYVTTWWRA